MQRVLNLWREDAVPVTESDAYILGECFPLNKTVDGGAQFSSDFRRRAGEVLWLMYRTQFPAPIPRDPAGPSPLLQNVNAFFHTGPSGIQASSMLDSFSSDVGWGCMIRTGQSLLANALVRLGNEPLETVRSFRDEPDAPYSIHKFVDYGAAHCGKRPGEWFGPSAVASCISAFAKPTISTYIAQGMDVYEPDIMDMAFPVLVLVNLRLGINEINPVYYEGLRALLQNKYSVGISGGRTSASHYFYGVQGTQLFYHDPHDPKPALTAESTDDDVRASLESANLRALKFEDMDPSMLVGFLLPTRDDFAEFKELLEKVPFNERVIHIMTRKPSMENLDLASEDEEDGEMEADPNRSETDGGFVVCSTPEPEVPESIEAKEPGEESMTEVKA